MRRLAAAAALAALLALAALASGLLTLYGTPALPDVPDPATHAGPSDPAGELSLLTLNVEEFFEPCLALFRAWEQAGAGSLEAFARAHPGVLAAGYVRAGPEAAATWASCRNMSEEMWSNASASVRQLVAESGADVVALQEFAVTRLGAVPEGYRLALVASTGEPGWKDVRIGNALLVRETLEVAWTMALDLVHDGDLAAPRAAACAQLQMPEPACSRCRICSLHLTGGRFDDEQWERRSGQLRTRQLQQLLSAVEGVDASAPRPVPLLLAGDFNAQLSPDVARPLLGGYGLFAAAAATGKAERFLAYMTEGHGWLHDRGYRAAFYPPSAAGDPTFGAFAASAGQVNKTSRFGAVVDWIYYPEHLLSTIGTPRVRDAIGRSISDHQAIQVSFRLPAEECRARPREFTDWQKAALNGFGMALPSMFATWFGYALQVRNTRETTVESLQEKASVPALDSLPALWRVFFWTDWPGRMIATYAVGLSTFVFWCAFYIAQSSFTFGGRSMAVSLVAAVVNAAITTPIWTVVVNMQRDGRPQADSWDRQVASIYASRGLAGLCAGLLPNLLMIAFPVVQSNLYHGLALLSAAALRERDPEGLFRHRPYVATVLGGLATMAATTATYPVQVVRNRWQAGLPSVPSKGQDSCCQLLRLLYLGYGVKMAHGAVTTAVTFTFKEQFYAWAIHG